MIKRSVPRYSQPQYQVRPNRQFSTLRSALLPIQGNGRMVDVCASRTFTYGTNIAESVFVKGKYTGNTADGTSTILAEGACQNQTFSRIAIVRRNYDPGGSGTISDSRTDSAALGAQWFISGSEIGLNKAADTAIGASTGAGITTGVEYVVGVTYDGTTAKFYIDGRAVGSGTAAVSFVLSGTGVLFSRGSGGSEQLNGYIGLHADFEGALPDSVMQSLTANPWQIFEPRKQNIYVSAASGGQTLTPSLYTDADTFYSAAVSYDVTLTPALFSDADTFYAATVSAGAVTLTPALYGDADTFYSATVVVDGGPQTLTPSLYADADTFHAPTVTPGAVSLAPSIYTDADTFHAATVAASYNLQPAAHADADTFYSATVSQTGDAVLQPGLFTDADTFYTATVASVMFLSAPRQLSSNTQTARRSNKQTARRP